MLIFLSLIGFILGLIFFRGNIVLNVAFLLLFIAFLIYRLRDKRIWACLLFISVGLVLPKIPLTYTSNDNSYAGFVIESKENYFLFQSHFEKFYVYEKENEREIGDYLVIEGYSYELNMTSYESRFNFSSYLNDKGIRRELKIKNVDVKYSSFLRQKAIKNQFLDKYDEPTRSLIDAFLFNNKNYDSEVISLANELNLIFVFSFSGIYLSFFIGVMKKIFKLFLNETLSSLLPLIILTPLLIFVFPKIGFLRVYFTSLLTLLNTALLKKKYSRLTIVSFLALTFLFIDFHLIYQSSFYIGFLMSLFMIFLRRASRQFKRRDKKVFQSIFAILFIFPISSMLVYKWYIFSPIFQILIIPFNELYLFFAIASFYSTIPFNHLMPFLSNVILYILQAFSPLNIAIDIASYFVYFIPLYYAFLIYLVHLFESKRMMHISFGAIPLLIPILISMIPVKLYLTNAIYFINVGQGDSILIKNKNHIVMIDTGGNTSFDIASEVLIPFLKKEQIYHIDALITTHNDADHTGGAKSLIRNFKVNNYYERDEFVTYTIGDIHLENINHYHALDENDSSLVFNLDFLNAKWLLMGDASVNVEKYLIDNNVDIDCDYLKVGHHGSKTSSSEEFLSLASPKEAIISVGKNNQYHHPNDEVIERLNKMNITIRRTDIEGTISFSEFAY